MLAKRRKNVADRKAQTSGISEKRRSPRSDKVLGEKATRRTKLRGEESYVESKATWRAKLRGEESYVERKAPRRRKLPGETF
jgi:ribosomal protein S8E